MQLPDSSLRFYLFSIQYGDAASLEMSADYLAFDYPVSNIQYPVWARSFLSNVTLLLSPVYGRQLNFRQSPCHDRVAESLHV